MITALVLTLAVLAMAALLRYNAHARTSTAAVLFTRAPPTAGLPQKFTPSQLAHYSGDSTVLLVAIEGHVYEVSSARQRYGPGGSYAAMAGRDITHHLARYTLPKPDEPQPECPLARDGLSDKQIGALEGWVQFFSAKYPVVGRLTCADGSESVRDTKRNVA